MGKRDVVVSEIINDIRRFIQVSNEKSKLAYRETGLTGPQLWTIKMIRDLSPIRVSDLASRMYIHPATLVGILNRLEMRGLIKRIRTNEDRRVVKIELTNAGNKLVAKAPQVAQGLLVSGLETLPQKNLQHISSALKELVNILGAQKIPPQLIFLSRISPNKKRASTS